MPNIFFALILVMFFAVNLRCVPVVALSGVQLGHLLIVILVLGLLKWDRIAVVMRAATQQVRALDDGAAAEAASAIVLEAALSFLGLGVQPPLPSWGLMISEAKNMMVFAFWMIAWAGSMLAVLVFSINRVG